MYGTPFCTHSFTESQLAGQELVSCECGNKYKPAALREFAKLQAEIQEAQSSLGALVKSMAVFNTSNATVAVAQPVAPVAPPAPPKPAKPKRQRPSLSVTQWLIVAAGFMVLVAASVFVSQNLKSWNVYGWSTLELSLGVIAAFGAFKLKKFSILLSNFLAVFSSSMLLTLIMSFSTTFGLGFTQWNNEPAWFWSINLGLTGLISLLLGMWSKNFGWRAIAPLSITASSIVLVLNSAGTFEDRWRTTVLSVALFAVLISVRLSRNSKWALNKKDSGYEYLKDLQEREDNSLKRFGVGVSVLLAGYAGLGVLAHLVANATSKMDGVAALVTALVWLVGARINQSWITAIIDKPETVLRLRDVASGIGLSFLGLGTLSLVPDSNSQIGLAVAVALVLLVFALERFVKVLLLPTLAVTISAWVTIIFGAIWHLLIHGGEILGPLGWYLSTVAAVLSVREYFKFSAIRTIAIYATGFAGGLVLYGSSLINAKGETPAFAVTLVAALVGLNLVPLLISQLFKHAKQELPAVAEMLPLVASSLVVILSLGEFANATETTYLMSVGSGFLALALIGMHLFRGKEVATKLGQQTFVALALSLVVTVLHSSPENLKSLTAFFLVDGLLLFGYSLLAKSNAWSIVGYSITTLSVLLANYAWGTPATAGILAAFAILVSAGVNLGFLWATKQFGGNDSVSKYATRIVTALSLLTIIECAKRFVPLDSTAYWLLVLVPALIAVAVEIRSSSVVAFIYSAAALVAAPNFYWPQSEVEGNSRILVSLAVLSFLLIRRARSSKQVVLGFASIVAAGFTGYFAANLITAQFAIVWSGPEIYSIGIAAFVAVSAWLTREATGRLNEILMIELPVLIVAVPGIFWPMPFAENKWRILFSLLAICLLLVRRARSTEKLGFSMLSLGFAGFTGFVAGSILQQQLGVEWLGPEIHSILIALAFAGSAWLTKTANGKLDEYLKLDLPVLTISVPSLIFALGAFYVSASENANRMFFAALVIWAHNVWRTHQRNQLGWLIVQAITGIFFAWSLVREIGVQTKITWDGPEPFSLAILATVFVGLWLAKRQQRLTTSLFRQGLPLAIGLTPSALYSWSSVTKQFNELSGAEVTRTLLVLVIAGAAMVFGILKANRGLNLIGTAELWLIAVPGLWFKTSAIDNGSADLELRGLLIAALVYWFIALLRKYSQAKFKSIVWIGLPVTIALAPAILHTLSSLGGSELRSLDWWRFSIVLAVSLTLLVVGSLREIGGTFFPGLIGVVVTVLPYGFVPIANREWFLWVILLGVAGLLVWLAVRLENMRKAGREPSAWLKELK